MTDTELKELESLCAKATKQLKGEEMNRATIWDAQGEKWVDMVDESTYIESIEENARLQAQLENMRDPNPGATRFCLCGLGEENARLRYELEKTKQDMHLVVSDAGKELIQERDRMRSALEWYADEKNWLSPGKFYCADTDKDCGQRAREALKGKK